MSDDYTVRCAFRCHIVGVLDDTLSPFECFQLGSKIADDPVVATRHREAFFAAQDAAKAAGDEEWFYIDDYTDVPVENILKAMTPTELAELRARIGR